MSSRLKKVRARRGAATLGCSETAPRLVRRATRSRSGSPRVHRRDLGFDEHGAQTRTLSARPKIARRHSSRPLQDGYARRRPAPCGLVAQKAFDRPINAASFEEWVEKCLVPTLSKGDIVDMDNLSSHKGPRVEQLITAAGAELRYLPPYSPDMNPIEKAYSKLKAFLRKIAERTVAGLLIALDACADIFKPAECVNYFKACGYDTG